MVDSTADSRKDVREGALKQMREKGMTNEEIVAWLKKMEVEHLFEGELTPDNIKLRLNRYQLIRQQQRNNALPRGIAFS